MGSAASCTGGCESDEGERVYDTDEVPDDVIIIDEEQDGEFERDDEQENST